MENVSQIEPYQRLTSWNQYPFRNNRQGSRKKRLPRSTQRRFFTLSRMADDTHTILNELEAPFRLCVYQDDDDLFMDVIAIDQSRKTTQVFSRAITHDKTRDLVRRIHTRNGLILDYRL